MRLLPVKIQKIVPTDTYIHTYNSRYTQIQKFVYTKYAIALSFPGRRCKAVFVISEKKRLKHNKKINKYK